MYFMENWACRWIGVFWEVGIFGAAKLSDAGLCVCVCACAQWVVFSRSSASDGILLCRQRSHVSRRRFVWGEAFSPFLTWIPCLGLVVFLPRLLEQ